MNILQGIALSFSGSAPLFIAPALGARFPLWAPAVSTQVYKYLSGSTYLLLEIGINPALLKWKGLIESCKHWKGIQAEHPAAPLPVGPPKLFQQQGNLSLPPETDGPGGATKLMTTHKAGFQHLGSFLDCLCFILRPTS